MADNDQSRKVPSAVLKLARIMTDLELASRGEHSDKLEKQNYAFNAVTSSVEGVFHVKPPITDLISLPWLIDATNQQSLPGEFVRENNLQVLYVSEKDAKTLNKAIQKKIEELKTEHIALRHAELREQFAQNFESIFLDNENFVTLGLQNDLAARTPDGLIKEAGIAYAWLHAGEEHESSPAQVLVSALNEQLDEIDTGSILTSEERAEIFKNSAQRFISIRKLKNTMDELGNRLDAVLDAPEAPSPAV